MTSPFSPLSFKVPGPRPLPLVGRTVNAFRFVNDSVGYTHQLFQTYGNLVALAEGGNTRLYSPRASCPATVFACGPEMTRQVTMNHDTYYKYPLTGPMYRNREDSPRTSPLRHYLVGLFGVNEGDHLQQRKLMMPAFHRQRLESYAQDMIAITQNELDNLSISSEPGEVIDMAGVMRQITLRIATKSLFGEDIGTESGRTGEIIQEALKMQLDVMIKLLPFDVPGLPWHRYLNLINRYETLMRSIIATKQQQGGTAPDVLSMLTQVQDEESKVKLTADELLGHVGVLFVAGHETSANALTWTLLLLSQHPDIMADLLDELDAALHGEAPTLAQLPSLPLLERVIKESMRILTPVPWNGRVTAKPTELGGYSLPEGTEVMLSIYQTHHMPELYPNPESFDPSRWETITPTSYEYNPFSAGPRVCIGAGFAMMEIKLILAMLLQRYRLEFVPQHSVDRAGVIVMSPKQGLPMTVHPQDRQFKRGVGKVQGNVREMVTLPG